MAVITTNDTAAQYANSLSSLSVGETQDSSQTTLNGNLSNAYSTLAKYLQEIDANNNEFSQPTIDAPNTNSSSADLEAGQYALMVLFSELNNAVIKNIQLDLNNDLINRKKASDDIIKKLHDCIHKMESARRKERKGKVLSIITDVFTCIGAALAVAGAAALTVATGTAAAPLLAITSLMLIQTVASVISKHSGGPDMSISAGITALSLEILKGCGMSDEQARKFAPIMAMGLTLVFMAATLASGNPMAAITPLLTSPELLGNGVAAIAKESGASDEESMYIGMAVTFTCALVGAALMGVQAGKASQLAVEGESMAFAAQLGLRASQAGIIVGLGSAGTTIGSSSLNISVAEDQKDIGTTQADIERIKAIAEKIMAMVADKKDDVTALVGQFSSMLDGMSKMVKERSALMLKLSQIA